MTRFKCSVCGKPAESAQCWKHKPKKRLKRNNNTNPNDYEQMWALFREIFKERGPYSELDQTYLGSEPLSWMFDHLLEKSKYPSLKFEKENILMVTLEQHEAKTNGKPWPAHQEAIKKAAEKFLNV